MKSGKITPPPSLRFGLDSLMAVELAALLARDAGVTLAPDQIREITFAQLHELCNAK